LFAFCLSHPGGGRRDGEIGGGEDKIIIRNGNGEPRGERKRERERERGRLKRKASREEGEKSVIDIA